MFSDGVYSFGIRALHTQSLPPGLHSLSHAQGTLETERKFSAGENKSTHRGHMNMKKLDDETEEFQRKWAFFFVSIALSVLIAFVV